MKSFLFNARRLWFIQIILSTTQILFFSLTVQATAEKNVKSANHDIDITWFQEDAGRNVVFLSTRKLGKWSEPEHITDYYGDSLHPTIDRDAKGNTWLAWTAIDYQDFQIHYTVKHKKQWGKPKIIATITENNIAPFLMVDNDGIPWVVWSGNNEEDDDIYFSRFLHGSWQNPQMVHPDNDVPDILPRLDMDKSNIPIVTWEQYSPTGYKIISKVWDGKSWNNTDGAVKSGLAKSYKEQNYSIVGREWDGRQWIKNPTYKKDLPSKQETMITGKDTKNEEIQLPPFVENVRDVYIRFYK